MSTLPHSSDFVTCIRQLCEKLDPQGSPLAKTLPEGLRVHHEPGLAFASSDIAKVQCHDTNNFTVWTNFLGLTDGHSPVPDYLLHDMVRCDDNAERTRDFLNIFHHRLYELLFFGLQTQDLPLAWSQNQDPRWHRRVQALLGLSDPTLSVSMSSALLFQTPGASMVETALRDALRPYLKASSPTPTTLKVKEFCGGSVALDCAFHNQLGRCNHSLGQDCVLGEQVIDRASKIELVIEHLDQDQFRAFEPGGRAHERTATLLGLLLARLVEVELVLHLHPEAAARQNKKNATLGQAQQIMAHRPEFIRRYPLDLSDESRS